MSPRLYGVREWRDHVFYDTATIEPGAEVSLFETPRIGKMNCTNLQQPNCLSYKHSYAVLAIGARLLGKSRVEEDLLLDHLRLTVLAGSADPLTLVGPHVSMIRHALSAEELKEIEVVYDRLPPERKEEHWYRKDKPNYTFRVGYHFIRPLIIEPCQRFTVQVDATTLQETVTLRVHLFGLETREIR